MEFAEMLRLYHPISDETIEKILESSELRHVLKGTYIIKQEKNFHEMIFILNGIYRLCFILDGKEETWAFGGAGDPWLSIETLLRNEPARFSLQALSDGSFLALPFKALCRLTNECDDFLRWQHKFLMIQMYYFSYREEFLAWSDVYIRFKAFVEKRDQEYVSQIPLKYVAQYLKMTPETLSRMRKRYAMES